MKIRLKSASLIILSSVAFWLITSTVYAGPFSMEEVRSQYQQETGKDWEGASADEKKEFLDILEIRKKANNSSFEKKGRLEELKDAGQQKERAQYNVRQSFENETGISWDDATEEQQERFQTKYDLMMRKIEREENARERKLKFKEDQFRREMAAEKREEIRKEKLKEQERKLELAEERRQRKEEQRRIIDAKKRLGRLQEKK